MWSAKMREHMHLCHYHANLKCDGNILMLSALPCGLEKLVVSDIPCSSQRFISLQCCQQQCMSHCNTHTHSTARPISHRPSSKWPSLLFQSISLTSLGPVTIMMLWITWYEQTYACIVPLVLFVCLSCRQISLCFFSRNKKILVWRISLDDSVHYLFVWHFSQFTLLQRSFTGETM